MSVQLELRRTSRRCQQRRGLAVLLVLMLLSVTLAASYAVLRSQGTTVQIQSNADRRDLARQAAMAGVSIALRKMHETTWTGVDTSITGSLSSTESYKVTFTTGDPSLTSTSANYADYPFRVTLLSVGTSSAPTSGTVSGGTSANGTTTTTVSATRSIQVVVKLVPCKLGSRDSDWASMQNYTVWLKDATDPFMINMPMRIEGPVRGQGAITIGAELNWSDTAKGRYLSDLNLMRSNGYPDYRPLTGPLSYPYSETASTQRTFLSTNLGLTTTNIAVTSRATLFMPIASLSTYRIYAGGKQYQVPQLGTTVTANTSLAPSVATNPLGIYFAPSGTTLKGNVTVQGTLITADGDDIHLGGSNIQFVPFDLPAVKNVAGPVRLPGLVSGAYCYQDASYTASFTGTMVLRHRLILSRGGANQTFNMVGRLIADGLDVYERSEWDVSSTIWNTLYSLFNTQLLGTSVSKILYLPPYLATLGYNPQPLLTIKPADSTIPTNQHWQDPSQPFYVPGDGDPGLRWDLLSFTELP